MTVIDLTRPVWPGMPVYPGDPPVQFLPHADYGAQGFRVTELRLGTHAGTHVDAPVHFLPGTTCVDALRLNALVGPARVISLGGGRHEFRTGERVLLRSGWAARWGEADYFRSFPGLDRQLAERLAAAPVALVGLETPSLHADPEEDAFLHRLLLGHGAVIVENLVNLQHLPECFFLAALPLPLAGLDGAPARVVAIMNDTGSGWTGEPEPQGSRP